MKVIRSSVIAGVVWLSMVLGGWVYAGEDPANGGISFTLSNHAGSAVFIDSATLGYKDTNGTTGSISPVTTYSGQGTYLRFYSGFSMSNVDAGKRFGYKGSTMSVYLKINIGASGSYYNPVGASPRLMPATLSTLINSNHTYPPAENLVSFGLKFDGTANPPSVSKTVHGRTYTLQASWHGTGWIIEVKGS